ncbi:hypothetical protein IAU60_000117 [Kwoniella sp. DSM 27419]
MALLHILAYAGGLAAFLFVTLSLASGLLWLAELIEEHSKYAKYVGMRAIYAIIALHAILYFTDSLPLLPILFSILCHVVYLQNFSSSWPFISLTSPRFILSCILVVADHFTWFFHFAAVAQEAKKYRGPKYRYGSQSVKAKDGPAFGDVAAFFAICVWFVPLFLFLSLSANDNALPSFDAVPSPNHTSVDLSSPMPGDASPTHRQLRARSSTSLVKSVLNPILSILPRVRRSGRKNHEGIIAPRTPIRGSPLHSPVAMPQTYFPWGSDDSGSSNPSVLNLSPQVTPERSRTPPPPRRIQSAVDVSRPHPGTQANPRGIATRDGRPWTGETDAEVLVAPKRPSPLQQGPSAISLGRGSGDEGLMKRKGD